MPGIFAAGSCPASGPGKRTARCIDTILTRITLAGAIYLAMVAILPDFLIAWFQRRADPVSSATGSDSALPSFVTAGDGRVRLLRRQISTLAHRRGRGDGHDSAGRVAAHQCGTTTAS